MSVFRVFLVSIFPHLDWIFLRIQSECRKIQTRKTPNTDTFHAVLCTLNFGIMKLSSGPYFPVFGLNTKIYSINLPIPPEYKKIRTRKNSIIGHFSRSVKLIRNWNCQLSFYSISKKFIYVSFLLIQGEDLSCYSKSIKKMPRNHVRFV